MNLAIMDEIYTIYNNDYGISFQWKRDALKDLKKIQLVFRDTGLFLTLKELAKFAKIIEKTINRPSKCNKCKEDKNCKSIVLETPAAQVSFAMSYNELLNIKDLVEGTLFKLQLENIYKRLSIITN